MKGLTADDFKELDDAWLSQYGFDGSYTTDFLVANGCPNAGASSAYVVFEAAMHFGVRPRGIVSEKSKNNSTTGELEFLEKVDGTRVYVGISLPFRGKTKSKFSVEPNDRAYEVSDDATPLAQAVTKKRRSAATDTKQHLQAAAADGGEDAVCMNSDCALPTECGDTGVSYCSEGEDEE